MKKLLMIFGFISIALLSCEKDDEITDNTPVPTPPPANSIDEFSMFHPGNYWIYEHYKIDSNGNETLLSGIDSCYYKGDTLINGNTYQIVNHWWVFPWDEYFRDSSGYLLRNSVPVFTTAVTNDTFYVYSYNSPSFNNTVYCTIASLANSISIALPAGNFNNILDVINYEYIHAPFDTTHNPLVTHTYFAKNIGKISEQYYFSAEWLSNTIRERRLVRYHVN